MPNNNLTLKIVLHLFGYSGHDVKQVCLLIESVLLEQNEPSPPIP